MSENTTSTINSPRNDLITEINLSTPLSDVGSTEATPPTPPSENEEKKCCNDEAECCDEKEECCNDEAECCNDEAECCDEKEECCNDEAECCDKKEECCDEKAECCDEKHTLPQLEIPSPNIKTPPLSNEVQSETVNRLTFFESDDALLSDVALLSDDALLSEVKTLSYYVSLLLHATEVDNKYSVAIDPKIKSVLELLLKENNYFENIEKMFTAIIKDNKIDSSDVPLLMNLLVELYIVIKNNKKKISIVQCGEVLKIIFTVVVKEKLIPITNKEAELLRSLYNILEMSVHLSQTDVSGNEKGILTKICKCFK